jgi:hypothetical protein
MLQRQISDAWSLQRATATSAPQGLLMHKIEDHPSEQPFVNPRPPKRARDNETGILRVEVGEQRLNGGRVASVGQVEMCSACSLGHGMVTPVAFLDGLRKAAQRHAL